MIRIAAILLLAGAGLSCSRSSTRLHLALIPAENLSGNPSLDWISPSVPAILATQLEGLPETDITRVPARQDAPARARVFYCKYAGAASNLTIDCWQDGTERIYTSSGDLEKSGLRTIVSAIGTALFSKARPAAAIGDEALRAYASGEYTEAVRLSPDFGLAYTDGAARAAAQNNRELADKLIADGLSRGAAIGEIETSRLRLLSANLHGSRDDRIKALERLTALLPLDSGLWQQYAQLLLAERKLEEASAAQEKVTSLEPESGPAWNLLGYFRTYAGDLAGGKRALERYLQLAPETPNPLDSLGEIHYYAGEFQEAEKYFLESMNKDERFYDGLGYFKAASARLQIGDADRAAEHFEKFAELRAASKDYLQAEWLYLAGDAAGAEEAMRKLAAATEGEPRSRAWAQVALWAAERGDFEKAREAASVAIPAARTPGSRFGSQLAAFVSQPGSASADEWSARAHKLVPAKGQHSIRLSFELAALLVHKLYADAEISARKNFLQANPANDWEARHLLAWALTGEGKTDEAKKLLSAHPIPPPPLASPMESILFRKALEIASPEKSGDEKK